METALRKPKPRNREAIFANPVIKAIYERRAVRKYTKQPVERQLIEQIIAAGRMAPSAINKQLWKFYVLTDRTEIHAFSSEIAKVAMKGFRKIGVKGIMKMAKELLHFSHGLDFIIAPDPIFHNAPVVIFITAPKFQEWAALDIGMCCQNMMLAAKSFGLDSCPIGLAKFVEHTDSYSRLNIPSSEQIHLAIIVGYGNEVPSVHERKKDNVIFL